MTFLFFLLLYHDLFKALILLIASKGTLFYSLVAILFCTFWDENFWVRNILMYELTKLLVFVGDKTCFSTEVLLFQKKSFNPNIFESVAEISVVIFFYLSIMKVTISRDQWCFVMYKIFYWYSLLILKYLKANYWHSEFLS